MSKISIISPSFNQAAYVTRMTASVSCQTYVDYEHLVLDPGSTDRTLEHLREYAAVNPNVVLILEPDRGQIDAINKGLARATGSIRHSCAAASASFATDQLLMPDPLPRLSTNHV